MAAGHPLLGAVVELAEGQGAVLTGWLSVAAQPWLADHVVLGSVLLAGTALVELAVRAGDAVGCAVVEELTLQAPLVLPEHGAVQVQVVAGPEEGGGRAVRVFCPACRRARYAGRAGLGLSCHRGAGRGADQPVEAAGLAVWPPPGAEPVAVEGLYEQLAAAGMGYGPAFRGLAGVWRRGEEVFAEARLGEQAEADAGLFGLHPGLFDAVLHALGPGGLVAGAAGPLLPFSWSGVSLHAAGAPVLRARLAAAGADGVSVVAVTGRAGWWCRCGGWCCARSRPAAWPGPAPPRVRVRGCSSRTGSRPRPVRRPVRWLEAGGRRLVPGLAGGR